MNINPVSSSTFKGLFTDNSKANNGNWRMEYSPYSWEQKMAPKVQLDITAHSLPDNEEIYIDEPLYKESRDILGTVSYYKDQRNGADILRRNITEVPSMNLEDSLKVLDRKYDAFIKLKQEAMTEAKQPLESRLNQVLGISLAHDRYASDISSDIFSHVYNKEERERGVKNNFDKMTKIAEDNGADFKEYIRLSESMEAVRAYKENIREEIAKIEKAKLTNSLIDISRRDVKAPDEALHKALQNLANIRGKLVALAHRTIPAEDILNAVGNNFKIYKAIEYVENLMKHRA